MVLTLNGVVGNHIAHAREEIHRGGIWTGVVQGSQEGSNWHLLDLGDINWLIDLSTRSHIVDVLLELPSPGVLTPMVLGFDGNGLAAIEAPNPLTGLIVEVLTNGLLVLLPVGSIVGIDPIVCKLECGILRRFVVDTVIGDEAWCECQELVSILRVEAVFKMSQTVEHLDSSL
jgi:hypothetical protein